MSVMRESRGKTVSGVRDIVSWGEGLRPKLMRLGFPCLDCSKAYYDADADVYSCPTFWKCRRVRSWFKDHWQYAVEDILEL